MRFDIAAFLSQHGVPYVTEGKNVSHGNIGIACPWCGDDPSHHLGINPETGQFNCWRNPGHKGKTPHRLIMKVAGISYEEACRLLGDKAPELSEFEKAIQGLRSPIKTTPKIEADLELPPEFHCFGRSKFEKRFVDYLIHDRGFERKDIPKLTKDYDLRYVLQGFWKDRIVFPLYYEGKLVTWTARSIHKSAPTKYLSLSRREKYEPPALMSIKDIIFNYDDIRKGGETLMITEGPFDALKVDFYGKKNGVRATCLFGLNYKEMQLLLLTEIALKFKNVRVMLDSTAYSVGLDLMSKMSGFVTGFQPLPDNVDDPGDMSKLQVESLT